MIRNLHLEWSWERTRSLAMMLAGTGVLFLGFEAVLFLARSVLPAGWVSPAAVEVPGAGASSLEPLAEWEKKFSGRNLFPVPAEAPPAATAAGPEDRMKDISLIGLVSSGVPEAIVKDARSNQTYLVHEGQRIRDLVVKEIRRDSIVVQSGHEEKEIFLQ